MWNTVMVIIDRVFSLLFAIISVVSGYEMVFMGDKSQFQWMMFALVLSLVSSIRANIAELKEKL